ncbi:MFS general substrate transporter [Ramaria rubella]|nr:MFS general substrate transporter [Ramaria rubella]
MPWGILKDKHLTHVPGTATLLDTPGATGFNLKRSTGVDSDVILVPQPSDDPRDPLNWPRWRKECIFWILSLGAGLVGAIGHLLNPGFVVLAKEWGVSVNACASEVSNNTLILALGCIMLVQAPLAVKFGRRPVYIIAAALLFSCSIWSAVSQGLGSFTGSRVFQGIGEAPFEALVTATIGDIYFVHERGLRVAIWSFAITAGINIGPIVNGYVIQSRLGWRFCFWFEICLRWFITAVFGILLIGIVFLVPETTYNRETRFETDRGASISDVKAESPTVTGEKTDKEGSIEQREFALLRGQHLPRKTFLQELPPWSGYMSDDSFIKIFLRPFPFFLSPVVWFGIFIYGLTVVWFACPIYRNSSLHVLTRRFQYSASQAGLVSLGPLVGSIIAALISGPLCDFATTEFAKRNNGVYEPESRLFLLIPMLILEVFVGPVMMYTIINVGQGIGTTGAVAYIIDVHRKNAPECFALINFVKNIILYGIARIANSWVTDMVPPSAFPFQGVLRTFGILAGLSAISILTGVPMYIYGKRARSFVARNPRWEHEFQFTLHSPNTLEFLAYSWSEM